MQLPVHVYCETEYFESKECHSKIFTVSLITLFTFSVPVVKATGLSFSVVHRSYYILVLNNKKFMFFVQLLFCSNVHHYASSEVSLFMGVHVIFACLLL